MTGKLDASFEFTNLQGFAALRSASDTPEGRRAVAQQFEGIFLNLMLSQMRSAGAINGGLIDDERLEFQQNLFDQQLALSLARGRGIGLADAILRSLGESAAPPRSSESGYLPTARAHPPAPIVPSPPRLDAPSGEPSEPSAAVERDPADLAASPADFVAALWPHAERAARELGTVPEVLVAQAALETGWGRSMPRNQYGEPSLNLFGIKAGADWRGARAVVTTLEFVDGVPERRREPFRMYRSLDESFGDYVALVRGKPRYAEARNAASAADYARALQEGGYATDPDYAAKIAAILSRGLPGREAPASSDQVIAESADTPIAEAHERIGREGV